MLVKNSIKFRVVVGQANLGLTGGLFCSRFHCCYICESSYLIYLSFNFDFYVSKTMHL